MFANICPGSAPLYIPPTFGDVMSSCICRGCLRSRKHKNQMPKPTAIKSATPPTTPPAIAPTGVDEVERPVPEGVTVTYTVVGPAVEVGDGLVERGVIEAEGPARIDGLDQRADGKRTKKGSYQRRRTRLWATRTRRRKDPYLPTLEPGFRQGWDMERFDRCMPVDSIESSTAIDGSHLLGRRHRLQ